MIIIPDVHKLESHMIVVSLAINNKSVTLMHNKVKTERADETATLK